MGDNVIEERERRYQRFHDSLVTAVEMTEHPDHAEQFNPDMLAQSFQDAQAGADGVREPRGLRLRGEDRPVRAERQILDLPLGLRPE